MPNSAISTNKLLINYPLSGRHYAVTSLSGFTILDQVYLDASAIGTELAALIKFYQYQMNLTSVKYLNDVLSKYIKLISNGGNYSKLVQAYIGLEASKIPVSVENPEIKESLLTLTQALIDAADDLAFVIRLLKNELELIRITFQEIADKYDNTLNAIIKTSGQQVEDLNKKIEEKNKEIQSNIEAIVQGGKDLSEGLNDLGNGTLTTISDIPSEKKEKEEKARLIIKDKKPDPNYAIESIILSADGIKKGTTATKALASNNKELALLYQEMTNYESIYSVAISTKIQNQIFIENFDKCTSDAVLLDTDWLDVGRSCSKLKENISNLKTEGEAITLMNEVNSSTKEWVELDYQLTILKTAFTGR